VITDKVEQSWLGFFFKILKDVSMFNVIIFIISVLSIFYSKYLFCLLMPLYILRIDHLFNILLALVKNYKSLLLTMGFGIIVTYIYASVGFNFFWVDYTYSTNGGDGPDIVML